MSDILLKIYDAEKKAKEIINQAKNDIEKKKSKCHSEIMMNREICIRNLKDSNQADIAAFQKNSSIDFENKKRTISDSIDLFLKTINKNQLLKIIDKYLKK